jgi:hypothetical protein
MIQKSPLQTSVPRAIVIHQGIRELQDKEKAAEETRRQMAQALKQSQTKTPQDNEPERYPGTKIKVLQGVSAIQD